MKITFVIAVTTAFILLGDVCKAAKNDGRTQYPFWLRNSYIGFSVGYIDQPFSHVQLERGYRASSIEIPKLAVSAVLLGHHFSKNFSAQLTYARPVQWVKYKEINGIF